MLRRALIVWLGMFVVAIAGAAIREGLLVPALGAAGGHIAGTLLVSGTFLAVIAATVRWIIPSLATRRLLLLGAGWMALTAAFEFGFGHWVMGHPWSRLLADYDVAAGRIWLLVLVTLLVGPVLTARMRPQRAVSGRR